MAKKIIRSVPKERAAQQQRVMDLLEEAGAFGMTWKEVADSEDWHHGQASGALSTLHKEGLIARVKDRRGRSKIYLTLKHAANRELSPYKSNRPLAEENEALRQEVERLLKRISDLEQQMAYWEVAASARA